MQQFSSTRDIIFKSVVRFLYQIGLIVKKKFKKTSGTCSV